jgi:hypothetical protein
MGISFLSPGEDIVRDSSDVILVTQSLRKGQHQSSLTGSNGAIQMLAIAYTYIYTYRQADIQRSTSTRPTKHDHALFGGCYVPANANGESTILPVTTLDQWHFPVDVGAWTIEDIVGVAVAVEGVIVGVADASIVGVRVGHFGGYSCYRIW